MLISNGYIFSFVENESVRKDIYHVGLTSIYKISSCCNHWSKALTNIHKYADLRLTYSKYIEEEKI